MNFESIENVKKMLDLDSIALNKVDQSIITLKDETTSEQEKSVARSLLLSTLGKAFLSNKAVNQYVVEDELLEMQDKIHSLKSSNIDDSVLKDIISDMEFYLSSSMSVGFEKKFLQALEELQNKIGIHKDVTSIKSSLQDIMEALKLKAHQNSLFRHKMDKNISKKPGENAQKRLDSFENNVLNMIDRVENIDVSNKDAVDSLEKDLLNLIGRLAGLNRIIDAKREDDPIVYKNATKTSSTTTNTTTTEMQKYQNPGFGLQRGSAGPIENPTTEKTFKLPKSVKYFLAGVGTVVIILGISSLVKNSSNKNPGNHPGSEPTSTVEPTVNPSENPGGNSNNNISEVELEKIADELLANWIAVGVDITKEDMIEILYSFRGLDSTYTMNQSDMVVLDSLNVVLANALNGVETKSIDFASLIADDTLGKAGVDKMQSYFNGCIEDPANKASYVKKALEIQAKVFGEQETVDGIDMSENSTTDPRVRIIWSRLAMGVNMFVGTLENDIVVEVNGKTYLAEDLIDNVELTNYIKNAKSEITGEIEKRMSFN